MDAVVLAGGEGTRLRPLTRTRHKSLVPVCNRPALAILLQWLAEGGVSRAVLAVGQAGAVLLEAAQRPGFSPIPVTAVEEREPLGSGGAIRNAVREAGIEGRFLAVNGDIYAGFPLAPIVSAHERAGAQLTIALVPLEDPTGYGVAELDPEGRILRFAEKPPPGSVKRGLVNAGVWVFERELVEEIPPGPARVEETLFPALAEAGRPIFGVQCEGTWADLGTPERYLALHRQLLGERSAVAARVAIAPGAAAVRSAVGEGSEVGPGALVEDSVLWERVQVGAGASVIASVVADGVFVGAGALVRGCVVGSGATIAPGAVAIGRKLEPGERYDGRDEA
jgi:mannose-1-phosphate guanylyltransferase